MAIDPKLLVIKPVNELESVTGLQAGELLFYDGSNNLKKIDIDTFNNLSKTAKPLKPTDATPTVDGLYIPTVSGTYANAGGLIAQEGYYTLFFFNGTTWTKSESKFPQAPANLRLWSPLPFSKDEQVVKDSVIYIALENVLATDVPGVSAKWKSLGSDDEDVRKALKWFLDQQSGVTEVLDKTFEISNTASYGNLYGVASVGGLLQKTGVVTYYVEAGSYFNVWENIPTKTNGIKKIIAKITPYGNNPTNPTNANIVGMKADGSVIPLVLNMGASSGALITYDLDVTGYKSIFIGMLVQDSNPTSLNQTIEFYKEEGGVTIEDSVKNYIDENGGGMHNVIDLIEFGCKGDGVTDDTIKFNEAIVLAMATGKSIYGRSNRYKVTSLSVPFTPDWKKVEIFGDSMATPTFGTIGSYPSYPTFQKGFKIISNYVNVNRGVIHVESGNGAYYDNLNNVFLVVRNCTISTYSNPQISGINAEHATQLHIEKVVVDTNVYNVWTGEPTHNTFGVIPPAINNNAYSIMRDVTISGYTCNLVGFEHLDADNINLCSSKEALRLNFGSHAMRFGRIGFYRNAVDINITADCVFSIEQMNCEYVGSNQSDSTNAWQKTQYELNDPNSLGKGRIYYANTRGAIGKNNVFRMNGATNVIVKYINSDVRLTGVGVPDPNPIP